MTKTESEWAGWSHEHRACFQTAPIVESVRGDNVQVGFSVTLYVAAPLESKAGPQREQAVVTLWDELKRLALDVATEEQRTARVQVEQSARVVLRPENEFKPEVHLTFHLFPRGLSMEAVTRADRDHMAELEKRLQAFGVKQGRA
jgi:uncharacterized protein YcfL